MTSTTRPEPFVGMAATINLYTDTRPAVVTRVNAKSIQVRVVDTEAAVRVNDPREPFPVLEAEGILDKIIGAPERYKRIDTEEGPRFSNGSISVTLGRSVRRTDYRH